MHAISSFRIAEAAERTSLTNVALTALAAGTAVVVGIAIALAPIVLLPLFALALCAGCTVSLRLSRLLLIGTAALLPFHAYLTSVTAVPSVWKEGVIWILFASVIAREGIRPNPLTTPVLAFVAAVLLSAAFNGRFGVEDLSPYFVFVPLVFVVPALIDSEKSLKILAVALLVGTLVDAGAVILGAVRNLDLFPMYGYAPTFLGQVRGSSFAGTTLLTATLLAVVGSGAAATLMLRGFKGGMASGVLLTSIVLWLLLASLLGLARGAIFPMLLAIVLTPVLLIFHAGRGTSRRLAATGLVTIALLLMGGLVAVSATDNPYKERLSVFTASVAPGDEVRASRWEATLDTALDSPVIGVGPGFTGLTRVREVLGDTTAYVPLSAGVPISESNVLKVFAETGIVGILAALWLLATATRMLWSSGRWSNGALIAFVAFWAAIVNGLFLQTMESYLGAAVFWGLLGAAAAYTRLGNERAEQPGS